LRRIFGKLLVLLGLAVVINVIAALTIGAFPKAIQKGAVKANSPSDDVRAILSWLPADSESLFVANGPFTFPDLTPPDAPSVFTTPSPEELRNDFEAMPLSAIGFRSGVLANRFIGAKVSVVVEAARHFRAPTGLGETLYEGCSIAVFSEDVSARADSFLKESLAADHPPEKIEDQNVTGFNEQLESDKWTILVAFPNPKTVIACTNRDFLRDVLARVNHRAASVTASGTATSEAVAFPDSLPEWKYVDARNRFWAIRHFDKSQAAEDPTSPLTAPKKQADGGDASLDSAHAASAAALFDDQAIGLTFNFDPYKAWAGTVTYLSSDPAVAAKLQKSAFAISDEPAAAPLKPNFRDLAPGVVSISYQLTDRQAVHFFNVMLSAALGHAVYL
jgi:hypothetical protein